MNDEHRGHYGKAMVALLGDTIEVTVDCVECGRIKLGPFNLRHTRSLAELLKHAADNLGLPEVEQEVIHSESSEDEDLIDKGREMFERMGMEAPKKRPMFSWLKKGA